MPSFFRFTNPLTSIRGQGLTFWNTLPIWGAWYSNSAFTLSGSAVTEVAAISGTPSVSGFGYGSIASDYASGAFLTGFGAAVSAYASGGTVSGITLPTSGALTGACFSVSGSGAATLYTTDASGNVYKTFSGTTTKLGSFGNAANGLAYRAANTTLYSVNTGASGSLETFNVTTSASGTLAVPFFKISSLAVSGIYLAVGGWCSLYVASGFTNIALDPTNSAYFAATPVSGNKVAVWTSDASGNWSLSTSAASSGAPNYIAWTPLGNTVFTSDNTNGYFQVFTYTGGVLTLSQVLTASGAGAFAVTSDSTKVLLARTAASAISPVTLSGATWAVSGTAIATPNTTVLYALGANSIVAGGVSGLSYFSYNALTSTWSLSSSAATSGAVRSITQDTAGNLIYVADVSGFPTVFTVTGSATVASSGASIADAVLYQQGQVVAAQAGNNAISVFSDASFGVALQKTFSVSGNSLGTLTNIAASPSGVFVLTSGATYIYNFSAPYTLSDVRSGVVSVYNGTTWTSTALNGNNTVEALAFDASGNVTAATLQNGLFTIATSGGIVSSQAITVFSGQQQSASLGIASLAWSGTTLYGTSTQNESFIQVSP